MHNIFESSCNIVLPHPKYVKMLRGKKTDNKDTQWIADIFKHNLASGSFMPPADIRLLETDQLYYVECHQGNLTLLFN